MHDRSAGAELLWLDTLQSVTARAAHELKGALSGVSVNLEVVRGRAAQAEQPASAVSRFAMAAATQLDVVIDMNEGLLALARRAREPADVGVALRQVAALLVPVAQAARTDVTVSSTVDGMVATVAASSVAVRTVIARAMMALMDAGGGSVQLAAESGATVVRLEAAHGEVVLDARTVAVAADAGIEISAGNPALTLTFPVAVPVPAPMGTATHETA